MLETKVHDRKLPQWVAQRYKLIGLIRNGLSVLAAAHRVGCAKDTCVGYPYHPAAFRRTLAYVAINRPALHARA